MILSKKLLFFLCCTLFCLLSIGADEGKILSHWDFVQNKNLLNTLSLRGKTRFTAAGLHTPLALPAETGGAVLQKKDFPILENAFSIEAKIMLDPVENHSRWRMILDNKYVAAPGTEAQKKYHKGVMFFLMPRKKDTYRMGASFGFGDTSARITGRDIVLLPGKTYTLKLLFTGTSKAEFYLDGKKISSHTVPAKNVIASDLPAVFGNRSGANYYPLCGSLRSLTVRKEKFIPAAFSIAPEIRRTFERGEKKPFLTVSLYNFLPEKISSLKVKCHSAGKNFPVIPIKELAGKSEMNLVFPVDPYLLPGEYPLSLTLEDNRGKILCKEDISYWIVSAGSDFLPVLLWGNHQDIKEIRKAGFTHQMVHLFPRTGDFQKSALKKWIPHLDSNLKENLYTFGNLHGHFRFLQQNRFLRKDKNGKAYPRKNIEASNASVRREFASAAASTLAAVGSHPAFDGVLLNSEVRDSSLPSYASKTESEAFFKFSGYSIPETVSGKSPLPYVADSSFPWDRVISSKRKDYVFLRWFWLVGDGWNPLQSLLSATIHDTIKNAGHKNRFFTFYDPATRVPPLWGSGGNVDMIGQWTYTYPDPIKIGQATDELIAMAQGKDGQKIGTMTQAIWYRSQTAPANIKVKNPPAWLEQEKEAQFISISPDNLREAFWSKIARKVDFIMYHGVGSLLAKTDHKLYRYTNEESKKVLAELSEKVIVPLGPVLKRIPEKSPEVVIFQNLASSFYAPEHFPFGWSKNWSADLHLALQWGNFQPGILYDEHLFHEKNTGNLKVLFVPGLEVVTEEVLAKLNELRLKGVIIIGDEFTLPALMLDHRIKSIKRDNNDPAGTKKALQKLGGELASLLDKYSVRNAVSSNQDLVVRQRGNEKADYIFLLNDKRTFGNYVGQWKKVQEKGLPNSGMITVRHKAAAAYDLVEHKEIPLKKTESYCSFKTALPPGGGKVILLLQKEIAGIRVKISGEKGNTVSLSPGKSFTVTCDTVDKEGKNIEAILPVEISLTADNGIRLPGSGFYAAEQGKLLLKEVLPTNLPAAVKKITVTVRCLASGKSASKTFTVGK